MCANKFQKAVSMSSRQTIGLITLVALFFIWGFFTSMNDILIRTSSSSLH